MTPERFKAIVKQWTRNNYLRTGEGDALIARVRELEGEVARLTKRAGCPGRIHEED